MMKGEGIGNSDSMIDELIEFTPKREFAAI